MRTNVNRRGFLALQAALAGCFATDVSAEPFDKDCGWTPFYEQYYMGVMNILTGLRDTQLPLIEREMKTAYELVKKGGTIYSQITSGHFPTAETALDRAGQPAVFAFLSRNAEKDEYAKLKSGDMIITNTINLNNIEAMKRGIRVVVVTVNYYPFYKTPPGEGYQIEYEGKLLKMEDTGHVTIDSQMPWDNGLVHAPQNPQFAIIPGGGLTQAVVYWMCAAELAGLLANNGVKTDNWARRYVQICIDRAVMVGSDRMKVEAVANVCADLVTKGGRWYVFSANHAIPSDALAVANGPMVTRAYKADQIKAGDIVMIGSYESGNAEEIVVARESRNKGAFVIALAPFSTDGDSSGDRLFKETDAAFNTYSPESWGVVPVKGRDKAVCPTTGVIADLVMWLLVSEWTENMAVRGEFPLFYKGLFMKNGREYIDMVIPYSRVRGW